MPEKLNAYQALRTVERMLREAQVPDPAFAETALEVLWELVLLHQGRRES